MRKVKVIGISLVRNEADIVGITVAHHLSQGLDEVIVLDNGSTDGTGEVLRELAEKDGRVTWRRDDSPFDQASLTTELAREAHRKGADWVLPFDADEFWCAEGGDFKKLLAGSKAGALRVRPITFVQARGQHDSTPEALLTMTRRLTEAVPANENSPRPAESNEVGSLQTAAGHKWISRPTKEIKIGRGNHRVRGVRGECVECDKIVFLHAPLRSKALLESKVERSRRLTEAGKTRGARRVWRWTHLIEEGKLDQVWAANSYEGEYLDVYGERHAVVFDSRLRDAVAPHILGTRQGPSGLRRALTLVMGRARGALAFARSAGSAKKELEETKRELERTRRELKKTNRRLVQAGRSNERMVERRKRTSHQIKDIARDYLLCKVPNGSVCAEIGVHEGDFSEKILEAVHPERLHLIDPWRKGEGLFGKQAVDEQAAVEERYAKVKERFAEELAAGRVQIHRALSNEIADEFEDSSFDLVYVDGNHLYEYVKQDLELYYPKVKTGGHLAGDDYGIRGYWDNGIQKAVDEFVAEHPEAALEVKGSQFIIRKGNTLKTTSP